MESTSIINRLAHSLGVRPSEIDHAIVGPKTFEVLRAENGDVTAQLAGASEKMEVVVVRLSNSTVSITCDESAIELI